MLVATTEQPWNLSDLTQQMFLFPFITSSTQVVTDKGRRVLFHMVIQVSRLVNSSSHNWSIWNMWLGRHHGDGREEVVKAGLRLTVSMSLSLMVNCSELGTWFPILVLCSCLLGIHLYILNTACCSNFCSATRADLWEQHSANDGRRNNG